MKKSHRLFLVPAVLALFVLALPRPASPVSVGFKFFGGYGSFDGGDMNDGLKGEIDGFKTMASLLGISVSGDYKPFGQGLEFGGDLILYFSPIIGVGFGAGMIDSNSSSKIPYSGWIGSGTYNIDPEVKVIPIRAGLYFAVPMGSFINLTLSGGAEYHLAKFTCRIRDDYGPSDWSQSDLETESKGKIGAFAGLGLEFKIMPNLSFFFEGRGRLARIDGFSGSETETSSSWPAYTSSGDLWYVEVNMTPFGWYPVIVLSDTPPPSDPTAFRNARSARLNLDGFSVVAGIMIRI